MNPFKPNLTQTRSFETFKPNTSRVDKLENQITILIERIAKLERDLTYHIKNEKCLDQKQH